MAIGEGSWIGFDADESMALGYDAKVNEDATNAVALGVGSETSSENSLAVGSNASVDEDADGSIAIGEGAAVESSYLNSAEDGSTGAVALGSNAHARNRSTTAIGSGAIAWGDKSTALGNNARTAKDSVESVSVGYWAQANADNSIALGSRSVADEANTVSVGNDNLKRRITNVGAGVGNFDAVNVKQMKDTVTAATVGAGMVTWDPGTTDTIHGVQLSGDSAISAASDRFSVDRYGNIAAQTYGGQGDNTNYYFNMNHADGISMGYSNGASINVDPNGVHFKVGEQETSINGNTMVTGRVNADTVQADAMYVGTQIPDNAVVTQSQLTDGIDTATEGMVKWDPALDEEGNPVKGQYADSIHGVGLQDGNITGNSLVTNSTIAGQNYSVKIENGAIMTTGNAQSSIGGVTFRSGSVTAENATVNTLLKVGGAAPNSTTRIQGGTVYTGSVTGLTNTEWNGTTTNESRAATEGQLADLTERVNENAQGVVKWDAGTNDTIHGVQLAGSGAISAASDRFSVDKYGNIAAQTFGGYDEMTSDGQGIDNEYYQFTMDDTDGITMGSNNGASMNIHKNGVTFTNGSQSTIINGNNITTYSANGVTDGQISTGHVYASQDMYIGGNADANKVATMGDLGTEIGEVTEGMVKWDTATDADGNTSYTDGVLHGLKLKGETDGSSTFSTISQVNGNSEITLNKSSVIISADTTDENDSRVYVSTQGSALLSGDNAVMVTPDYITLGNSQTGGEVNVYSDGTTTFESEDSDGMTTISGDAITTGSLTAADGAVKIHDNGLVQAGDKILLNSSTGQIIADSVGSNAVVTTTLSAGNGGVRVDKDGKLTTTGDVLMQNGDGESISMTDGGLNLMTVDADNGTGMVTVANGAVRMIGGGNTTVKVDGSGTTFGTQTGMDTTTISGGSVTTNSVTGLTNRTWTGSTTDASRAATEGQLADLSTTVSENAEGVVKWDQDANGDYQEGTIHGVTLQDGAITAANGNFSVDELGNVTATVADTNNSFSLTENGVSMKADNTTLDVTSGGVAIGNGAGSTYINGSEINTGTVLAGEMYVGTKDDGNAVVTKDQLTGTVGEATEGVVKWDKDENGDYQEGKLTVDSLTAAGGTFTISEEGIVNAGDKIVLNGTTGQVLADRIGTNDVTTQSFTAGNGKIKIDEDGKLSTTGDVSMMNSTGELVSLTDDNGLTMVTSGDYGTGMLKLDNGRINMMGGTTTTVTIDNSGTTFTNLANNTSTIIDGNTITTGTINADGVTVDGKDVATVDDVTNATKDAVKYDENGELHAGKDGTGSLDLSKENGSASLSSGNGEHSIVVDNNGTTVNGGLNVNGGLTIDGDTVATSGDVTEVKTDVSGIKNQIGVNEDGSYKTINNGAADVISGINTNTDSINTIKGQIGGSGENGALKLANSATTIESGINQNTAAIQQHGQAIGQLSHRVGELDSRIDEVGAGAAALAALHPLDFDPDAKWDFAAGYGNYRGENAVAVGTFYRPNEDVMFSVGGTFGNDDNMVNAGVSLKIGAGSSHVTTSRTAMAKEIKSMRDIVAKQDAQIQKLTAIVNALVGTEAVTPDTSTMFPDVPENHWAYEAVAAMAKGGLVKGYPDGEFKGNRSMTRYEFAQIVYNAIQAGAEVDARLVQEFKPELEYFHIDTIAKDKDGNPTIERVRVN